MDDIKQGIYKHFKGKFYSVFGRVLDLKNNTFVLYRALYDERKLWIRSLEMFTDNVKGVPRFEFVSPVYVDDLVTIDDFCFGANQYLGIATHSEDLSPYLVFRELQSKTLWVRELV